MEVLDRELAGAYGVETRRAGPREGQGKLSLVGWRWLTLERSGDVVTRLAASRRKGAWLLRPEVSRSLGRSGGFRQRHRARRKFENPKPLRVFLQVGERDNGAGRAEDDHHNWVSANRRMAEELAAKGYHYRFVFARESGHCDGSVRRQTLPDTLRWMWRGYAR